MYRYSALLLYGPCKMKRKTGKWKWMKSHSALFIRFFISFLFFFSLFPFLSFTLSFTLSGWSKIKWERSIGMKLKLTPRDFTDFTFSFLPLFTLLSTSVSISINYSLHGKINTSPRSTIHLLKHYTQVPSHLNQYLFNTNTHNHTIPYIKPNMCRRVDLGSNFLIQIQIHFKLKQKVTSHNQNGSWRILENNVISCNLIVNVYTNSRKSYLSILKKCNANVRINSSIKIAFKIWIT